ncbi:alkene reductase [Rhizobium glycinendophyticum]|uniref:Alkene reductase n=1 Tax=Rhizobium glycinendophyticum TaxID=2589807 RepID=A0A504U8T3_9HYPH|nr:alkene reductase [Rhizobium glycinendophyticum]TPP11574.1 alkene reductase [Rhizobium glycinendophyticum]
MSKLFEPTTVGRISVANRVAMAPLTRNRSPGAVPNDLNVEYYRQRAGAGLIVSEGTAISHQGQGYADVPGLYLPEAIEGWKKVTAAVHAAGGKIVTQLWHVGRISHTSLQPNGGKPVAPSAIAAKSKTYILNADGSGAFAETSEPRALELSEIPGLIEDYRKAARAAIEAGFDGVEIHAANGYLLEQFMRSNSNQRSDAYGGSIENRIRLTIEVVDAIVKEIGADRTGIRISPTTPANDVSDPDPAAVYTALVEKLAGFDLAFIHVIEGATGGPRDVLPFDWKALKAAYREKGGKGTWMVNNGYDRAAAMEAVDSGYADVVAFGRPFIANPDLVRRLKEDAAWNELETATLYGGGAQGYTTYPALA